MDVLLSEATVPNDNAISHGPDIAQSEGLESAPPRNWMLDLDADAVDRLAADDDAYENLTLLDLKTFLKRRAQNSDQNLSDSDPDDDIPLEELKAKIQARDQRLSAELRICNAKVEQPGPAKVENWRDVAKWTQDDQGKWHFEVDFEQCAPGRFFLMLCSDPDSKPFLLVGKVRQPDKNAMTFTFQTWHSTRSQYTHSCLSATWVASSKSKSNFEEARHSDVLVYIPSLTKANKLPQLAVRRVERMGMFFEMGPGSTIQMLAGSTVDSDDSEDEYEPLSRLLGQIIQLRITFIVNLSYYTLRESEAQRSTSPVWYNHSRKHNVNNKSLIIQ